MSTGEGRSKLYLEQRISLPVQRANAACVMGTYENSLENIFYFVIYCKMK